MGIGLDGGGALVDAGLSNWRASSMAVIHPLTSASVLAWR